MTQPVTGMPRWLYNPRIVAPALLLTVCLVVRIYASTDPALPAAYDHVRAVSGMDLPDWYGDHPFLLTWTKGDGQTFVALAVDPLLRGPGAELGLLDIRYSRVGYSLLGAAAVAGIDDLVPIGLLVVNVIAVFAYGWFVGRDAERHGPRSWWMLGNPAIVMAFVMGTAEAVALALTLAAIVGTSRKGSAISGGLLGITRPELLTVGTLGRFPTWVVAFGAITATSIRLVPAALVGRFGSDVVNVTWPGFGFLEAVNDLAWADRIIVTGIFLAATATLTWGLFRIRGWDRIGWIGYGLLILTLSPLVLWSGVNVLRVTGGLPLLWLMAPGSPLSDRSASTDVTD